MAISLIETASLDTGLVAPSATTATTATSLTTASGSAPSYSARAWVNFNGTGTVAIRASGNVSSITDNSTGNYTINITTAMPDANYATVWVGGGQGTSGSSYSVTAASQTASAVTIQSRAVNGGAAVDENPCNVSIFR
jgi:hypothetical protein